MNFEANNFYHLFNRGINRQLLFFSHRNYDYFLEKAKRYIIPHCSIISYCLMPNHFHFLIYADERTTQPPNCNAFLSTNVLSEGFRIMLSSYTKAINNQESRKGNLFQQNTKLKPIYTDSFEEGRMGDNTLYERDCFNYIHNNPVKAGLVATPGDWIYSSYNEYFRSGTKSICNRYLGNKLSCA